MSSATDGHVNYPSWAFRFWHGMTLKAWLGLLARNHFAVSPRRLFLVLDVTFHALMNSLLGLAQRLIFGRRIARTKIAAPPIFIVGHWRTGTTWLHELLALDPRFVAPTTYECLAPSHALLTKPVSGWWHFRAPKQRPMDAMAVAWERPQEDELALMNLGAGSFFETFAFPNRRPVRSDYLGLANLSERRRKHWIAARIGFMRQVLYRAQREAGDGPHAPQRRLVLKSPEDTARLGLLSSLFPGACFIHLVRNPDDIFESTLRFWRTLASTQALHVPRWDAQQGGAPSIEEFVHSTFEHLYRNFDAERRMIPGQQWLDLRYEDLLRDPTGAISRIYTHFGWDGFTGVRPGLEKYARDTADHRVRSYKPALHTKAEVAKRWGDYAARYGYASLGDIDAKTRAVGVDMHPGQLAGVG